MTTSSRDPRSSTVSNWHRIQISMAAGVSDSHDFSDVLNELLTEGSFISAHRRLTYSLGLSHSSQPQSPLILLLTNSCQKDLSSIDALIRSLAVRFALASDCELDHLAILKTASTDSSVYVRKTASLAQLAYLRRHPPETSPDPAMMNRSLNDAEPSVLSSAVQLAWWASFHGYSLPPPLFSRLVHFLPLMDPVGQFFTIDLLYRFSWLNFSPNSNHPQFLKFLHCIEHDILPYSTSAPVIQISIAVLMDLTSEPDSQKFPQRIWSQIVHHLSRLPSEYTESFLQIALVCISNVVFASTCPIDQFFIHSCDSKNIAKLKSLILNKYIDNNSVMSLSIAKMIVSEFLHCISTISLNICPNVSRNCVKGLAAIGFRFHTDLRNTVLQIFLALICNENYMHDDVVIAETVVQLRRLLISNQSSSLLVTEDTKSILSAMIHICHIADKFTHEKTRISALWLISMYHDSISLIVPNLLRSIAATIEQEQSSLVKVEICSLAIQSINFFKTTETLTESVRDKVVLPLQLVVSYILDVCCKDELVGDAVAYMAGGGVNALMNQNREILVDEGAEEEERVLMHSIIFVNDKPTCERPEKDRIEVVDEDSGKIEQENYTSRNMSSEQAAVNRTSAKVLVPSSVKPITTLEDLDLFFTLPEETAKAREESVPASDLSVQEGRKRATVDLSGLC